MLILITVSLYRESSTDIDDSESLSCVEIHLLIISKLMRLSFYRESFADIDDNESFFRDSFADIDNSESLLILITVRLY